jgi:DNA-binding NarL/FixJ family response regulator
VSNNFTLNLKVVLYDGDYYALQALNSYFAWDRRTRVTFYTHRMADLWDYLQKVPHAEKPDMLVMDSDHFSSIEEFNSVVHRVYQYSEKTHIISLIQAHNPEVIETAAETKVKAVFLKGDVQLQVTWAACYALNYEFTLSKSLAEYSRRSFNAVVHRAKVVPEPRNYPEMTERIRQAIKLCVIEGMPAQLAADEMGISLHTVRGYIKEGYRILESYDRGEYPVEMTPQERAFLRFTALEDDNYDRH